MQGIRNISRRVITHTTHPAGLRREKEGKMTDKEVMYHRFCHKNIKKGTGVLCKELGMSKKDYDEACCRAMNEESNNKNNKN